MTTGNRTARRLLARDPWPGLIEAYGDRLPVSDATPDVTLFEGGTPLVPARELSERTGCEVYLKVEGANPTGSFKDRGMTVAISKAAEEGAQAVICASTGNTSASAAAYAVRAGHDLCGARAAGQDRARQAGAGAGARRAVCCRSTATSTTASSSPASLPSTTRSRWSTRSTRTGSKGRRPRRSRSATCSAERPTCTASRSATPATSPRTGGATASTPRTASSPATPRMFGFQAAGAAPIVNGAPVSSPMTIATAIRIGNPASAGRSPSRRATSPAA